MANEVDDIVQHIVLTGNDEVAEGFNRIQEAGKKAFEGIQEAIEHSLLTFTGLGIAVGGVAASFAIAGVGLFEFVKGAEESVSAMSDLASQTGLTVEEVSGLRAAFASGGVGAGELETIFRRLSLNISQSWTEIKKASREGADQLKSDALAVSNAELAVSAAQQKLDTSERDRALTQKQNNNTLADARQRLDELNAQSLKNSGVDTTDLDRVLQSQRELLQLKQAQLALQEAKKKKDDDEVNAADEQLKLQNAAEQAQLSLNQARRKEQDDQKNDITNVINAIKQVAAGNADALKTINGSVDNIIKGIVGAAGDAGKAIGALKGDLTDLASPGPGVRETLEIIGKTLAGIDDASTKSAVGLRLFGRSVNENVLKVIEDPAKIDAFIERIKGLGLALTEDEVEISDKFRAALFGLQNDITLVGNKMAAAFGPGFTTVLTAIDNALINNRTNLTNFAATVSGAVVPVVESFIRVLSGAPDQIKDDWLISYIDKIKVFGRGFADAVGIVTGAVSTIIGGLGELADALNDLFGTKLNAFDLILGVWVAKAVINFAAFAKGAALAFGLVTLEATPLLIGLGLIAVAIYTAVQAWEAWKAAFGIGQSSQWEAMLDGAKERLKAIAEILSGDLTAGVARWKKANEDQAESVKKLTDIDKQAADDKKKLLEEQAKAEKEANAASVTDAKKAADDKDARSKQSADTQATHAKQLAETNKASNDDSRRSSEELAKIQADHPNLTIAQGSTIKGASAGNSQFIDVQKQLADSAKEMEKNGTAFDGHIIDVQKQLAAQERQFEKNASDISGTTANQGRFIRPTRFEPIDPAQKPESLTGPGSPDQTFNPDSLTKSFKDALVDANKEIIPDRQLGPGGFLTQPPLLTPQEPTQLSTLPPGEQPPRSLSEKIDFTELEAGTVALSGKFDGAVAAIASFIDFIRTATTNPGALKENANPVPENPNPVPEAKPAEPQTDTSILQSILEALTSILTKSEDKTITGPAQQLGIRGDNADPTQQVDQSFQTAGSSADSAASSLDTLVSAASNAASALNSIQSSGTAQQPVAAATGGYIRGPGGPTGDKIPALLSDEEYVHTARATRFWGVDFMHAINNLQMPRFAQGGLVGLFSPQMPRFASGGVVSGGASDMKHFGTVDLSTDHGIVRVAIDRTGLTQLRKAAVARQMGADRKSSWVR